MALFERALVRNLSYMNKLIISDKEHLKGCYNDQKALLRLETFFLLFHILWSLSQPPPLLTFSYQPLTYPKNLNDSLFFNISLSISVVWLL